jgi:hypothetical protein
MTTQGTTCTLIEGSTMGSAVGRTSASGAVEVNRRLYPRRRLTFPATFSVDRRATLPAFGLDLSGGGMRLFTQDPIEMPAGDPLALVALVEGRKVQLRLRRRWSTPFEAPAGLRYRHGLQLATITDRDWEFLMRVVLQGGDESPPHGVLSRAQVARLLGREKLHRVVTMLAAAGRLACTFDKRLPPMEYAFEGYAMRRGIAYYRFRVGGTNVLVGVEHDTVRFID